MRISLPNRVALSYVDQGDENGRPVLVLLPGLTDSWRSYERVLPHLPASNRVIAVSLRGHGDSDRPETGYRTKDFAMDVVELLAMLRIPRAVVVGHSSASLVAQRLAIDNPGRTAGIVLEGSFTTLRGRKEVVEVVASTIAPLQDPVTPEFVRKFATGTISRPVPQSFMDAMVQESLKVPARVWKEAFAGLLLDDHTSELGAIAAPSLLIWGDQDALIGREQQDALASAIPESRLVVYAGVGIPPTGRTPLASQPTSSRSWIRSRNTTGRDLLPEITAFGSAGRSGPFPVPCSPTAP